MTIKLTSDIRHGGAIVPANTTVTYDPAVEADLVARKSATYVGAPATTDLGVPAMVKQNLLTGVIEIFGENGERVLSVKDGEVVNGPPVKTLDPVDFYSANTFDSFGQYIYGIASSSGGQVVVIDRESGVQSNYGAPVPITGGGLAWVKAISTSRLIVGAGNGGTTMTYYLTADSGATWQTVLVMSISAVSLALNPKGLCVATIGGSTVLLAGEYNTNGARVDGSTNDRVRLLRSNDLGATWEEVTRWNTDGANNNIRHIHGVKQYEPNGRIYVMTGDTDAQAAFYSWDGVSAWPVNVTPANVTPSGGLKVAAGRQAFRAIDPTLKDGYLWWLCDCETGGATGAMESGVWKMSADLDISTLRRVATPNSTARQMAGWFQDVLPTGELVILCGNAATVAGQKYNQVVVSNRDWTDFKAVAAYRCTDSTPYPVPLLLSQYDGKLWVSCFGGSGKTDMSTVVCQLSANDFRGDFETAYRPDTIHPVYWVDETNGLDTNNGFRPSSAFKTISYAVTGARMTYGARLQIKGASITHNSGSITVVMNGHARQGDPTEPLVIAGDGATKTTLTYGAAATSFVMFQLFGATAQKLEWQDLTFASQKDTGTPMHSDVSQGAGAHSFGIVRCIVGDYKQSSNRPSRYVKSSGLYAYAYGSVIECPTGLANPTFETAADGGGNFYFENSVIIGANKQIRLRGATSSAVAMRNCIIYGAYQAVLSIDAGATVGTKTAIDCEFYSDQVSGSVVIADSAGLSWSGDFKRCRVSGMGYGVAAAFDGYSVLQRKPVPVVDYLDYVF